MIRQKDIIIICISALLLVFSLLAFQANSNTSGSDIRLLFEEMLQKSETHVKQKIWPEIKSDPTKIIQFSQQLENKGEKIFIKDHLDSLIFWSGQEIPDVAIDKWSYDQTRRIISHAFKLDEYTFVRSFIPPNTIISINTRNQVIDDYKDIESIVQVSNNWQKLLINGLFLILCLSFLKAILSLTKQSKRINTQIKSLGVLFAMGLTFSYLFFRTNIDLFSSINNSILVLCSALSFLGMSLVYLQRPKLEKKQPSRLILHTGLVGIIISGFVKSFELILSKIDVTSFEKLDFTNPDQLILTISAIIGLFAIWLYFKNAFDIQKETWTFKGLKFLSLVICYIIGCYLFNVHLPLIFAVLFLGVYFLSADLFYDITEPNITWLIWWVILNSAFLSSNLYFTSVKYDIEKNQNLLKSVYQKVKPEKLKEITLTHDAISKSSLLEKINVLPDNAKLLEDDIRSFLNEDQLIQSKVFSVFYFHENGASGMLNKNLDSKAFESNTNHYVQLSDTLKYDPYNRRFLLSFEKLRDFYLLSEATNQTDQIIKYGVFENANHVYGEITQLPSKYESVIKKDTVITSQAISHVFYKPESNILIYSRKTYASLLKPISLFSYIFCLSVLLLFFFIILNSRYEILDQLPLFFKQVKSLRLKIQLVILFLILLSFITVAWITGYYFNTILHNNKENEITNKVVALNNALQQNLEKIYDLQSAQNIIENEIPKLATINNTKAEYFMLNGRKTNMSNQYYPYFPFFTFKFGGSDKPFTRINEDGKVYAYFPLINQNLGLIGFIKMQNLSSLATKKESLSDFLGSMLNLYVFLFLIAGAITIAISRSITRPLSKLSEHINSIKVGRKNEIISWQSDDEIGELINSYNDMVEKLDVNIELMAKTERDMAWREMAKQVAHEIKNPLTPMKLSIQYLKQAISRHPERTDELVEKTSRTLIEQIENLVGIADAFSNMASLPQANNEKVVLNEVVEAVHDLFRKREDIEIKLQEPLEEVMVYADKGHLVRILNNLVKNAIQSIPKEKLGKILIKLYVEKDQAIIFVKDNGSGIPLELQNKIFTPKFTTKSSGSGLGLAISANMIESMNGKIYFESELGLGSCFFIEIPLIRKAVVSNTATNRIPLD